MKTDRNWVWRMFAVLLGAGLVVFGWGKAAWAQPAPPTQVTASQITVQQAPAEAGGIVGTWQGTLHLQGGQALRLVIKITSDSGTLKATMYSLDQGGQAIAATSAGFSGGTLTFAIQLIDGKYEGKLSPDGKSIAGNWTQANNPLPLVLERATPETEWVIPASPSKMPAMAADAKPSVEVATIKPTAPDAPRTVITFRGSEIVISRMTLNDLIEYAYNVQEKQIVNGPGWMGTDKFDINARPDQPGTPNGEQFRLILQKLLADRFALRFNNEQRKMSAYVLTVGKDGPRMTKSADPSGRPGFSEGPGGLLRIRNATMGDFANVMQSTVLDRPVVDRTGLKGRWEFILKWRPDETQFGGQLKLPSTSDAADNLPPLFTAIQEQLDLKLDAQKTAVDVLEIDHVDHPSPN